MAQSIAPAAPTVEHTAVAPAATIAAAAPAPTATAMMPAPTATVATPAPTATALPTPSPTPSPLGSDWPRVKPNELGRIMILEYHQLGPEEDRWTRSYANFWHDLELLYTNGFRPIGLNDLIDNRIDVPAGYSPVVLTFDDSSPMQFAFVTGENGDLVPDPNSAVGMLERFHALHADWRLKGTFFVLPGADPPHDLFGQKEYKERKLRYLADTGFEIGNHTFWHQRLDQLKTRGEVEAELARAVKSIQAAVPGYQVRALALPLGLFPADPAWAREGSYEGTTYSNEAVLLATGGSTPPPNHRQFDPFNLPRIQATNMELDFEEVYVGYFIQHPEDRYVSDGDPDLLVFPKSLEAAYRVGSAQSEVQLAGEAARQYLAFRLR